MALGSNYLADLFWEHADKTVDKWEHYIAIYSHELAPFLERRQPVRLLEVGVQNGGSLELWAKYLPQGSEIAGIDIDPAVGNLTFEEPIRVHVADATDSTRITELFGDKYFDVIIDDASHKSEDVIATFSSLFERLAPGGKYIIEDLHASYWTSHGGFRVTSSSIEYFKNLVDALNADHLENAETMDEGIVADLRRFGRSLARIAFYDSVVVVEKLASEKTRPYRRMIGGVASEVVDPFIGVIALPATQIGSLLFGDEQKRHIEAGILARIEETAERNRLLAIETAQTAAERAQLEVTVAQLKSSNQELRTELEDVYRSYSWRWTKPLRAGAGLVFHVGGRLTGRTKTDLAVGEQKSQN